jgi:hypothetical protein
MHYNFAENLVHSSADTLTRTLGRRRRLPMNRLVLIVMVVVGVTATGVAPSAEKRIALVVGNSSYTNTIPLRTPVNDAIDVASALDRLGFEVIRGIDLDYVGMREKGNCSPLSN